MPTVNLAAPVAIGPGDVVGIGLHNAGAGTLAAGVATFGQAFQQGDVPAGAALVARIGGAHVPVQMSVKTTHPDGSVKSAVIAVMRPDLAPGAVAEVVLSAGRAAPAAPPVDIAAALAGRSFTVDVTPTGGATRQIDVIQALTTAIANGQASFWQSGPLASEARVAIDLPGSQRLLFDVTVFADGQFKVNAQFNNDEAMTASGGRVSFEAVTRLDGVEIDRKTVSQAQYQNWRETYSSDEANGGQGTGAPEAGWLNIRHDIPYLQGTGAVFNYDTTIGIRADVIEAWATQAQAAGWGAPLANNGILQAMGSPGAREDLGFTTATNAAWLMSQDPRVAQRALDQAEVSGAVPWNTWDTANNTWLNTDAYPRLWTDFRGGTGRPGDPTSGGLTQQIAGDTGWQPQRSHQPDLSFVPYLLTGERMHLDAVQAQASFSVMNLWPFPRQGGQDVLVANQDQLRASAWSLRQIEHAAWSSPDGSAEKAYFQKVAADNWKLLVSNIPAWTAMQGEAYGWVPGQASTSGEFALFNQDYFAGITIMAAARGNADALTFLNWSSNFLIGRFLNADKGFNPRDGVAYQIAISPVGGGPLYTTWAQIGAESVRRGFSNGADGWQASQGEYGRLGMATLAGIWHLTGNPDALRAYQIIAAENPPFTVEDSFASRPNYAVTIPGLYGGVIRGGAAADSYSVGFGSAQFDVDLGGGLDSLAWRSGAARGVIRNTEQVTGGTGNDEVTIFAGTGQTRIDLGAGADRVQFGGPGRYLVSGTETIRGSGGDDELTLAAVPGGLSIDLGAGNDHLILPGSGVHVVAVAGVERVTGGAGNDAVTLTTAVTGARVELGGGTDLLNLASTGPNSVLVSGVETLNGGSQNDEVTLLTAVSGMAINLNGGNDRLLLATGTNAVSVAGIETILGNTGADTITFTQSVAGVTVDLGAGADRVILGNFGNAITLAGVETVNGGTSWDNVTLAAPLVGGVIDLGLGGDRLTLANGTNVLSVSNIETIQGGIGNDTVTFLVAATAGTQVDLSDGDDVLRLANATNTIGVRNVETVFGGTGDDNVSLQNPKTSGLIDLGAGNDRLSLAIGNNTLTVRGVDVLVGAGGNDTVTIGAAMGAMSVDLGGGFDRLILANGTNTITATGVEQLQGGTGNDTVTLSAGVWGISVDLSAGVDRLNLASGNNTLTVAHVETLIGNAGADTVTLAAAQLSGLIDLAAGTDRLNLAAGTNTLTVLNAETVIGNAGNDVITLGSVALAGTNVDLGAGDDRVNLALGNNTITLRGVETIIGNTGADTVTLSAEILNGNVDLGAGVDRLVLASANNTLTVRHVETLQGGTWSDTVTLGVAVSGMTVDLGFGTDRLNLAAGNNTLSVAGVELVVGNTGADVVTLTATTASTTLELGAGMDRVNLANGTNALSVRDVEQVVGGTGADRVTVLGATAARLEGGAGNDTLIGGAGADTLIGGLGRDVLTGGAGADRFGFRLGDSGGAAIDLITDFDGTTDKIVLDGVLSGGFSFIGAAAFPGGPGTQARFTDASDLLEIDRNGDRIADLAITLGGVSLASLSASDFVFGPL
jgi:Ca2+-binding RTX toxin-like protein